MVLSPRSSIPFNLLLLPIKSLSSSLPSFSFSHARLLCRNQAIALALLQTTLIFDSCSLPVAGIFQDISQRNQEFKDQKYQIISYMEERNISKQMQMKVIRYLQYLNDKKLRSNETGERIIQGLSTRLRQQLQEEYFGQFLKTIPQFAQNFSPQLLKMLSVHMKEITLGPGEILYTKGELVHRLFFLRRGELYDIIDREHLREDNTVLGSLSAGQHFGLYEFVTMSQNLQTIVSKNISNIVYLDRADFISVVEKFPLEYVNI